MISELNDHVEHQRETCEHERTNGLTSWQLRNRTDESQSVRMYYEVRRQEYADLKGPVWITVVKRGERWQVTRYDRYY